LLNWSFTVLFYLKRSGFTSPSRFVAYDDVAVWGNLAVGHVEDVGMVLPSNRRFPVPSEIGIIHEFHLIPVVSLLSQIDSAAINPVASTTNLCNESAGGEKQFRKVRKKVDFGSRPRSANSNWHSKWLVANPLVCF
jgi:hypothetical protein